MSSREAILNRIKTANAEATQFDHPGNGLRPHLGEGGIERFKQKVLAAAATLVEVSSTNDIANAVNDYLNEWKLPKEIICADTAMLASTKWGEIKVKQGASDGNDLVAVSHANYGIAETGTLVMLSSPERPITHHFLPDYAIYVIKANTVVEHLEDVWAETGKQLPRSVNFVTGPSRTADVEQTIQMGAHGPRQVHVILLAA